MDVIVLDRRLQRVLWRRSYRGIGDIQVRLQINDHCPQCGGPRGTPTLQR